MIVSHAFFLSEIVSYKIYFLIITLSNEFWIFLCFFLFVFFLLFLQNPHCNKKIYKNYCLLCNYNFLLFSKGIQVLLGAYILWKIVIKNRLHAWHLSITYVLINQSITTSLELKFIVEKIDNFIFSLQVTQSWMNFCFIWSL